MERYKRQELFIGKNKQKRLNKSIVAVIGLGALGSLVSELLARAGINLTLIDRDVVEITNLQRQVLFTEKDLGELKAKCIKKHLAEINSNIKISSSTIDLNCANIKLIRNADLILDCTDNLETRFLLNEFALKNKIPMVYGAAIRDKGTVMNIIPGKVCFNCIFNKSSSNETCDTSGVLNTITSLTASIQANEAIKILTNQDYETGLIRIDLANNSITRFGLKKNPNCSVCNGIYEYLNGKKDKDFIKFCGSNNFQFRRKNNLEELKKRLSKAGKITGSREFIKFDNIIIFKDRVMIKADNENEARSLYSKYIGD